MKNENEILDKLTGLEVTRTWISIGSWLWIELGKLAESGEHSTLRGEFTLEISGPWRLVQTKNDKTETLIHSESSSPLDDDAVFNFLEKQKLQSFRFSQLIDGLSISIFFTDDYCLEVWLEKDEEFLVHSRNTTALLKYTGAGVTKN